MMDPRAFETCVGTVFQAQGNTGPVPLRLVSVSDVQRAHGMLQFSLFFHGPADQMLPQSIYALRHETLGAMDLFLVPVVGSNAERIVYQACFNVSDENFSSTRQPN